MFRFPSPVRFGRFLSPFRGCALGFALVVSGLAARSPQNFSVLLYTSPDRYHNQVIPTAVTEFERMAEQHFFRLEWTQRPEDLNAEKLAGFQVLVFLHANARELNPDAIAALQRFVRGGGGFVGVHASSVDSGQDPWFKALVGRSFIGHPEKQTGIVQVVDREFPATFHLPRLWLWTDEWYEFGPALTDDLQVLLTVDESSYVPLEHQDDVGGTYEGMRGDHPVAWYQHYDGGRSFYTSLGHLEAAYRDPWFHQLLYGAIYWAATGVTASAEPETAP